MKKTKIYLNAKRTRYCEVRVYDSLTAMREEYKKDSPHDRDHDRVEGVHLARTYLVVPKKYRKVGKVTQKIWNASRQAPKTGIILLSKTHCSAGIATHEIMHAVLWGRKRKRDMSQYPIRIHNMQQEESLLRDFTLAVMQFYRWYWRVVNIAKVASRKK